MSAAASRPVVFVGPSLPADWVARALPHAQLEPPIGRGDLDRWRSQGVDTFLVLDGAFAHRLAVSPAEIVATIRSGARVFGAASMGAIRAAECWPAGMQGIGAVYRLYRLRVISSDDEVAVAASAQPDHRALSVALINVRYAMVAAMRRRLLSRSQARAVLEAAKRLHFSERGWEAILAAAEVRPTAALWDVCRTDVKRRDAQRAVRWVARLPPRPRPRPASAVLDVRGLERYPGHDRWLGMHEAQLRGELLRFLLRTGRWRRYGLPRPQPGAENQAWSALERAGGLDVELMRWYAAARTMRCS